MPASDAVVTLWRKAGSAWVLVTSTVSDADGVATFVVKPGTTTRYRAVTAGLPSAYVDGDRVDQGGAGRGGQGRQEAQRARSPR